MWRVPWGGQTGTDPLREDGKMQPNARPCDLREE